MTFLKSIKKYYDNQIYWFKKLNSISIITPSIVGLICLAISALLINHITIPIVLIYDVLGLSISNYSKLIVIVAIVIHDIFISTIVCDKKIRNKTFNIVFAVYYIVYFISFSVYISIKW